MNECVDRLEVFSQNPQWDVISIEAIFIFGCHIRPFNLGNWELKILDFETHNSRLLSPVERQRLAIAEKTEIEI